MRRQRNRMSWLVSALVLAGCGTTDNGSGMERDPFMMSHLTHQKEDPLFTNSESEVSFDLDEFSMQSGSGSVSRKPTLQSSDATYQRMTYSSSETDARHRLLEGQLEYHRVGHKPGWYVRYSSDPNSDRHGGRLRLVDDPRLGLFREGDRVQLEGKIVRHALGDERFQVRAFALLDE